MLRAALIALLCGGQDVSTLKSDEEAILFPTLGDFEPATGEVLLDIHAWVFEPEFDSPMRRLTAATLLRGLGWELTAEQATVYRTRLWPFLADNERGKQLVIELGGWQGTLAETAANGHVYAQQRFTAEQAKLLWGDAGAPPAEGGGVWLPLRAVLPEGDQRPMSGRALVLPPHGWSVITDIDDTIKITEVGDRSRVVRNTLVEPLRPVPGMAEVYAQWVAQGAGLHYVSSSPWQLYAPLGEFVAAEGFPAGTWHLKHFRLKDETALDLFSAPEDYKPRHLRPLLSRFPGRRFVCVGDSGEKDPEIYGQLAREFPAQVRLICIRDVTGEAPDSPRYAAAFAEVPRERWMIFTEASELPPALGE